MTLNKEQLEKVNEGIKALFDFCPIIGEDNEELIFSDERIKEIIEEKEDIKGLDIWFPGEVDYIFFEIDDFIDLVDEIKTIEIVNSSYIKTKLRRYYLVAASEFTDEHILTYHSTHTKVKGITLNLIHESIIVGMASTKLDEYEKDDWGAISPYMTIEIEYETEKDVLSKEEEESLINSYIFEIADTTNIAITFSEIRNPIYDLYKITGEIGEGDIADLRELEPYNIGMEFFVAAIQINDPELKFLNFYKVLEHFSPIAVNIEANELMRKKLDAPKSSFEDGDYIRSIFELANSMRDRFNDEDLIKASFNTCFDIVSLFNKLPESIKKKIKKHIGATELTYSTDKQKITTSCNIASKIIYKTRNKVVHAKSNFTLTGEEITSSEFNELNGFMKEASSQAIRWYSRQPNHLKLEIIK
ncbi:hypothetical protein R3X28_05105 [Maribacter sp. TH_r10]|uniref:hypothetical protein n=1 Tax=Maribacter sp. TH_r10 TaxID=3082086 RepID=UPI0029541C50|nr:hypothetical protein [Maribacter sp. TH_r10]MDV7138241.1 hypothetical protein [Maribacter sp. TH_r10]